jgi:hypothetical protein
LPAGTFIADYLGEIVPESESERRGLTSSDEYLFTLDCWGRTNACQKLSMLGLKNSIVTIPRHKFQLANVMDKDQLKHYLDSNLVDVLDKNGAIQRLIGKRKSSNIQLDQESMVDFTANTDKRPKQWYSRKMSERSQVWSEAVSIITDRSILETEATTEVYNIDAR